jgi:hypothetical protein
MKTKVLNLEKMLPADLPAGEEVVWFGRPDPTSLWRRAYRADLVATYFAALAIWGFFTSAPGVAPLDALLKGLLTLAGGVGALAILGLLAYLSARTTLYVVTNRRIVLKVGIALQIFHNVPFTKIESAALRAFGDGTGDIAVKLVPDQHIAYFTLWPSARPFHLRNPQPSLRCIAAARETASLLSRAMVEANGGKGGPVAAPTHAAPAIAAAATA